MLNFNVEYCRDFVCVCFSVLFCFIFSFAFDSIRFDSIPLELNNPLLFLDVDRARSQLK